MAGLRSNGKYGATSHVANLPHLNHSHVEFLGVTILLLTAWNKLTVSLSRRPRRDADAKDNMEAERLFWKFETLHAGTACTKGRGEMR